MLSLVIPVYRNEDSLPDLLQALLGLNRALGGALEVVFVVDGSPDRSHVLLGERLPQLPLRSQLLLLTRNFGAFAAVRVGLEHGQGEYFAVMAADLQEPPELVLQMQQKLQTEPLDVVVAQRLVRHDPPLQRWQSALFWWLYRRYVVADMPAGGVDIFACNRAFRDALLALPEGRSSLIAQIFWLGFRRGSVPYVRQPRRHGQSAWTWSRKLAYLADSVFAFSDLPLKLLLRLGALGLLVAAGLGLSAIVGRLAGWIAVPGYAMTLIAILFFGALNLFGLGIVGTYAWRAYENTKQRPLALVLNQRCFTPSGAPSSSHSPEMSEART